METKTKEAQTQDQARKVRNYVWEAITHATSAELLLARLEGHGADGGEIYEMVKQAAEMLEVAWCKAHDLNEALARLEEDEA